MIRDDLGDPISARDVLAADELADLNEPRRSYRAPGAVVFPALDVDGVDADGFEWGARTYGDAS